MASSTCLWWAGQQRVQQRKVQTGRRIADRVEILSPGSTADATSVAVRGAGFSERR
jgi:HlyD family secretion protein